jgi:hypothetical protein
MKRFPAGCLLAISVLTFIYSINTFNSAAISVSDSQKRFPQTTAIISFASAIYFLIGLSKSCPACKKIFSAKHYKSEYLYSKKIVETREETEPIWDLTTQTYANQVSTKSVDVERKYYLKYYLCSTCGHHWREKAFRDRDI